MKDDILNRLRAHREELNNAGVVSLSLFGSMARGDNHSASDVDLMAEFAKGVTLFDLVDIEFRLTELVEAKVDLSDSRRLKEFVRPNAERDAVRVF